MQYTDGHSWGTRDLVYVSIVYKHNLRYFSKVHNTSPPAEGYSAEELRSVVRRLLFWSRSDRLG